MSRGCSRVGQTNIEHSSSHGTFSCKVDSKWAWTKEEEEEEAVIQNRHGQSNIFRQHRDEIMVLILSRKSACVPKPKMDEQERDVVELLLQ